MSNDCFVPKCKNSVGAPFPRDPASKQRWLEGLQLASASPKSNSFVCFAHFNPSDLKEDSTSGRRLSNRLKKGAVPCIPHPVAKEADSKDAKDTAEELNEFSPIPVGKKVESKPEEGEKIPEADKICRACMTDKNLETHMFDFIEDDVTISSAFMVCVFSIDVSKYDSLPKDICKTCLNTLKVAYKFRKKCMATDEILRERYPEDGRKRKASADREPEKSSKKNRQNSEATPDEVEQSDSIDINSLDTFEVIYEQSPSSDKDKPGEEDTIGDSQAKIRVKHEFEVSNDRLEIEIAEVTGDPSLLSPTRRSRRLAHKGGKSLKFSKLKGEVDIDEIEKNLEEIHGQDTTNNSGEQLETEVLVEEEQATVSVNSDAEEGTTVEDILNTLEEGNSSSEDQNVLDEFLKKSDGGSIRHASTSQVQKKIVVKSNFPTTPRKELTVPSNIRLPKDVKIKPVERYQSVTGKFPSVVRTGVYDSSFVQADEYLFELGLAKGSARHLRCTVPTCGAHGKQKVLSNGEFDPMVDVVAAHNHKAPNEATKKKQMFLCIMRKKMQTDRTLNIRHIYEDSCLQDPDIKQLVPLRNVINEICRHQLTHKTAPINSFEDFFRAIEEDSFEKLHFTHNNQQFYQEKFSVEEDGSMAVLFGNMEVIQQVANSKVMYVDASFKIDTNEEFKYQLVTVLVWIEDSYYPILFALVNKKSQLIFRRIFAHLRDNLAPDLRPQEIITDYEANLYYALAEIYIDSNIGGSVFYYTQNLYKKICSLNLSRDLETNSYFRNIYHMLLMLPLLPVNTILDGLNNIELEAKNLNISELARPIFDHVRIQWILNVTPELFCVHKLENRINENVIAPFKKLRDFLLLTKGKLQRTQVTIMHVIEKIIELEAFLRGTYSKPDKKSFGRDLSSFQKKNVLRAWQFIEDHPKIEINNFFSKVLGYIKCMENQLWIWGFYRYDGDTDDILINAAHFSIVSPSDDLPEDIAEENEEYLEYIEAPDSTIVMEAVIDQDGVLQAGDEIVANDTNDNENVVVTTTESRQFESAYLKYVYR